jgi:predicted transposase YbfD/YdcC
MPRLNRDQKLQQELELQALAFFEGTLSELPDPRRAQGTRYPLRTVVVTALMAAVCGADDAEAMEQWGEANEEWLRGFLELPHGVPTQDVFLSVFAALDPEAFSSVFRAWASLLTLRLAPTERHIAVDGKTSRRSHDRTNGRPAVHTVSAWMSEAGLVLGQKKTEEKSNEIIAIPELLRVLDLRGATVTIDAMGCQTDIASTIVKGGGHYLLAVKDNQPTLRQEVETTFLEAADQRLRSVDEAPRPKVDSFEETDKGHGRLEKRTVTVCRDLTWVTTRERWEGLSLVAKVTRERTDLSTQHSSTETAYYIGSDTSAPVHKTAKMIRRHWTVETQLHWVLDVAFREDDARHRAKNTAQNMSTLRHFALNVIKQDRDRKLGVANTRKRAGWDRNYLIKLLTSLDA